MTRYTDTGEAHAVTTGDILSLERFQVHPNGKSRLKDRNEDADVRWASFRDNACSIFLPEMLYSDGSKKEWSGIGVYFGTDVYQSDSSVGLAGIHVSGSDIGNVWE